MEVHSSLACFVFFTHSPFLLCFHSVSVCWTAFLWWCAYISSKDGKKAKNGVPSQWSMLLAGIYECILYVNSILQDHVFKQKRMAVVYLFFSQTSLSLSFCHTLSQMLQLSACTGRCHVYNESIKGKTVGLQWQDEFLYVCQLLISIELDGSLHACRLLLRFSTMDFL